MAIKDKIVLGAAGGDRGVRDFIVAIDAATGKLVWRKYVIPAPGEPGFETWKDRTNAWHTGGGAMWVTGSYDEAANQILWGTGNPVPTFDANYRPGDNLYTNSLISWDASTGKMNWYFQYTPGDVWNYDEAGTHILLDGQVQGTRRALIIHAARNGFLYTFERANGKFLMAKPYVDAINWTKGIDQRTGKPLEYDPGKDIQTYSGRQSQTFAESAGRLCPSITGGNNFWPASYSRRTELLYVISMSSCNEVVLDNNQAGDWKGAPFRNTPHNESDLVVVDPFTGEVKRKLHSGYPNNSGVLSTAGGIIFTGYIDGTFAAFDDVTLEQLWKINVGTGFAAPPMTFEAGGKQYVAVLSGLSRASRNHSSVPQSYATCATRRCCSCLGFDWGDLLDRPGAGFFSFA